MTTSRTEQRNNEAESRTETIQRHGRGYCQKGRHLDRPEWVHVLANAKGRELVTALLPHAAIEWTQPEWSGAGRLSEDWQRVAINVPVAVRETQTKLPLAVIPHGHTIDDATPEQLAMLLALGVRYRGGLSALFDRSQGEPVLRVFAPYGR